MLRIVQVNAVYDQQLRSPEALLDSYTTLTDWSTSIARAGAIVAVVQRFSADAKVVRDGITYEFVKDDQPPWMSTSGAPPSLVDAVVRARPDVVHVNGLIFPALVGALRRALPPPAAIVAQHHGGEFPVRGAGPVGMWRRRKWRQGLDGVDACSFTASEQAQAWRDAGVLGSQPVIAIVEAGTRIRQVSRERARAATGLSGAPLILWVGRLTANKDPVTVLDGLEAALTLLHDARAAFVFSEQMLGDRVDERVKSSAVLRDRVSIVGRVPHDEIANYYGAADFFVSGSHSEGSGYALIEAMACGLVPIVTDIPPFRTIAGQAGVFWPSGNAAALSSALVDAGSRDLSGEREKVQRQFADVLSWEAIGSQTVTTYRRIFERRGSNRGGDKRLRFVEGSSLMRIAMVVTGGLHPSGREQVVPSLLALFSRLARDHEVHAFAVRHLRHASTYALLGFTVHDLGRPSAPLGLTHWAQERALRQAMSASGPFDLVHGFWCDPAGLLAVRAGQHFGIPSIVTCDSGEFVSIPAIGYGSQRTARGRAIIQEACSMASRVHVCTRFMEQQARGHGFAATVIPLGTATRGSALENPVEKKPGVFRLLQVASLSRVKNQQLAIDAVALLSQRVDVHLDLVGEDTLAGQLQESTRELDLADRVTFHGFLPQAELPRLFASADLYVQTSLHEAAGVSVLEAACSGVPVIGTRAGYVADWTPDRAVAIDDPSAETFARAIEELLADADRRRKLASSARAWTAEYDADRTASEFERLYQPAAP